MQVFFYKDIAYLEKTCYFCTAIVNLGLRPPPAPSKGG